MSGTNGNSSARGLFVTGISASGKSTLIQSLLDGGFTRVAADEAWQRVPAASRAAQLARRFKFESDEAEAAYLDRSTPASLWADIREQSVALWPYLEVIAKAHLASGRSVVLEGINVLPSLAVPELRLAGVMLWVPKPLTIAQRLAEHPRWSKQLELQRREAELLCAWVQPALELEAKRFGVPVIQNPAAAALLLQRVATSVRC